MRSKLLTYCHFWSIFDAQEVSENNNVLRKQNLETKLTWKQVYQVGNTKQLWKVNRKLTQLSLQTNDITSETSR